MQQVAAQGQWFLEVALVEWWRVQPKNSSSAPPKLFMISEISERIYFYLPLADDVLLVAGVGNVELDYAFLVICCILKDSIDLLMLFGVCMLPHNVFSRTGCRGLGHAPINKCFLCFATIRFDQIDTVF